MILNQTIMQMGSPEQILAEAHLKIAIPELLILYGAFSLILLIVGLIMIDSKKSGYSKFIKIYLITQAFVVSFILLPLLFMPNTIHTFLSKFLGIFSI